MGQKLSNGTVLIDTKFKNKSQNKSQSNMSIFHSQAGASSDPRRECENRYIVWRMKIK